MGKPRIFITGASGCVGSHLTRYLINKGYEVVACVRPSSRREALEPLVTGATSRCKLVVAELFETDKLAAYMRYCDVVVHAAASIQPLGTKNTLSQTNVEGTESALAASIQAHTKHFVHMSSLSVITGEQDRFDVTEDELPKYCREAYANSKIDAEKAVMRESSASRIAVTSLRPGFIYGPNEKSWLPRVIEAISTRQAVLVGDGNKQTNVIFVENLCRAIELSLLNAKSFGQIYNLTDGQTVTKRQLFDAICDGLGLPHVEKTISPFVARLLVESATLIAPLTPPPLRARLSRYSRPAFRLLAINQGFDITKAERDLNYCERISFEEGMAATLRHWNQPLIYDRVAAGTFAWE